MVNCRVDEIESVKINFIYEVQKEKTLDLMIYMSFLFGDRFQRFILGY